MKLLWIFITVSSEHLILSGYRESSMKNSKKSLVLKGSIVVAGRKNSVSVEDGFWEALREIAKDCSTSLPELSPA
jgi:predicted DNA-binding ribbon-helix-helix protein